MASLDGYRRTLGSYLDALERRNDTAVHPELIPDTSLDTVSHRGQVP